MSKRSYNQKLNYTKSIPCKNNNCDQVISVRYIGDPESPLFNNPIQKDKTKLFCSRECQKHWQQNTLWEDRVGKEFADDFRLKMHKLSSENNPSTFPGVAEKISKSLKEYKKNNPPIGEKNSFYGKRHSDETKKYLSESKKGKWSYNQEQKDRQTANTPKKENHPNWLGGISNGEYGLDFNKNLKTTIKKAYNFTCQLCCTETTELDVHHIDYDKKNNVLENLIPLCKSCHSKTNYNRKNWIKLFERLLKNKI